MERRGRGQATVESVGVIVAVALLLGALGAWAATGLRPPARPPDVVGRVAHALDGPVLAPPATSPLPGVTFAESPLAQLRASSFFSRLRHRVAVTSRWLRISDRSARTALRAALVDGVLRIVRDPVGELLDVPDPGSLTPAAVRRRIEGTVGDGVDYVRMLRGMPPDASADRFGRDFGRLLGEALVEGGRSLLRKAATRAVVRGMTRRTPPPPPPGHDAPAP